MLGRYQSSAACRHAAINSSFIGFDTAICRKEVTLRNTAYFLAVCTRNCTASPLQNVQNNGVVVPCHVGVTYVEHIEEEAHETTFDTNTEENLEIT